MKSKPGPIYLACILLLSGLFLFVRCKTAEKTGKDEVNQFLNGFNNRVKEGNTDSLMAYFDGDKRQKVLKRLVNLLSGKKSLNGKGKPLAGISLDIDAAGIKIIDDEWVTASIPATFGHGQLETKTSILILKIHKIAPHNLKIARVDARQFLTDYVAYENFVKSKTVDEKDIYSVITLASFKTAAQLKIRYDSVLWFDHVNSQTYYYVIKGSIGSTFYWRDNDPHKEKAHFKMGLVNPDLKEIIPVEYDLIHNISGTIDGLVEVERGGKKGFYNLDGKVIVPANFDQVFPLNDDENLALLRNDGDYFYLKKDFTLTDKLYALKIADILPKIKAYGHSFTLSDSTSKNIMEYNDREQYTSLVVPPSYLVDLQILPRIIDFQNPLRKYADDESGEDGEGTVSYKVKFDGSGGNANNWFASAFNSVIEDYLGARAGLYETKNVLLVDEKQNRILGLSVESYHGRAEGGGALSGTCNENSFRAINDTLFEFKTTSALDFELFDEKETVDEGPYYHYLQLKYGKLTALPGKRMFNCTKFVKMDDSYLNACFIVSGKTVDHLTPEILQYMKNEIYASYGYRFKKDKWNEVFQYRFSDAEKGGNANVDDSLTSIEKYNIQWINSKLNKPKTNTLAAK